MSSFYSPRHYHICNTKVVFTLGLDYHRIIIELIKYEMGSDQLITVPDYAPISVKPGGGGGSGIGWGF